MPFFGGFLRKILLQEEGMIDIKPYIVFHKVNAPSLSINALHIGYEGKDGECYRTDDASNDNRAQYLFDDRQISRQIGIRSVAPSNIGTGTADARGTEEDDPVWRELLKPYNIYREIHTRTYFYAPSFPHIVFDFDLNRGRKYVFFFNDLEDYGDSQINSRRSRRELVYQIQAD